MRGSRIYLALIAVAALAAFAAAAAPASAKSYAQIKPIKVGKYRVEPGSGGLLSGRSGRGSLAPSVFTDVGGGGRFADYSAEADTITAKHIKGSLGDFGKIDLRFHKSGPFEKQKLPHGCHGTPVQKQKGSWRGVFKFQAERGIAKVTRHKLKGLLIKPGSYDCGSSPSRTFVLLSSSTSSTFFGASVPKHGGKPELFANRFSHKGDVSIMRDSFVKAKPSAFGYAADYTSATVKGSGPFSGTGHFASGPRPRGNTVTLGVLSGSLKVSFLGKAGETSVNSNDAQLGESSSLRAARRMPTARALRLAR